MVLFFRLYTCLVFLVHVFSLPGHIPNFQNPSRLQAFPIIRKSHKKTLVGCTPNSVPMVFIVIVFSRDSCGLTHKYPLYRVYIGISHFPGYVGPGVHPCLSPDS